MANIVPFEPPQPPATTNSDTTLAESSGMRPCEPLTARQVWAVSSEIFAANGLYAAYKCAQRGYDQKRGCFWMRISDVPSHVLEVCVGQIGDKLETDFTMAATDSQDGVRQYLISINEIQNTTAEIRDATSASIAEYQAQRDKFRGIVLVTKNNAPLSRPINPFPNTRNLNLEIFCRGR